MKPGCLVIYIGPDLKFRGVRFKVISVSSGYLFIDTLKGRSGQGIPYPRTDFILDKKYECKLGKVLYL